MVAFEKKQIRSWIKEAKHLLADPTIDEDKAEDDAEAAIEHIEPLCATQLNDYQADNINCCGAIPYVVDCFPP